MFAQAQADAKKRAIDMARAHKILEKQKAQIDTL